MKLCRRLPLVVLPLLVATAATAVTAQEAPKKNWGLTADLGLVSTAGNSEVTTVNVKQAFNWHPDGWGLTQNFSLVYSEESGSTTAELFQGNVRGERRLGTRWWAYAMLTYNRNPFAGVARRFEETVGTLMRPILTERDSLEFDVGLSLAQQRVPDSGEEITFGSVRLAAGYRHTFGEKAFIQLFGLALPNLRRASDVRFQGEIAAGAPFTDHFALKASYAFIYDNVPDDPAFEGRLDRFLTVGLQVRF